MLIQVADDALAVGYLPAAHFFDGRERRRSTSSRNSHGFDVTIHIYLHEC